MTDENADYYTPEQIADRLQLERVSVMKMLRRGEIPGYKFGKFWRISKEEFARYEIAQRNAYFNNEKES